MQAYEAEFTAIAALDRPPFRSVMSSATRTRSICKGLRMLPKNRVKIELLSVNSWGSFGAKTLKSISTIEGLYMARTLEEAAALLGISENRFITVRSRLRKLGRCFLRDEPVPKQRGPYKKRIKRGPILDQAAAA